MRLRQNKASGNANIPEDITKDYGQPIVPIFNREDKFTNR